MLDRFAAGLGAGDGAASTTFLASGGAAGFVTVASGFLATVLGEETGVRAAIFGVAVAAGFEAGRRAATFGFLEAALAEVLAAAFAEAFGADLCAALAGGFFAARAAGFAAVARAVFFAGGLAAAFGFEAVFFFAAADLPVAGFAALAGLRTLASGVFFLAAPTAFFATALALGFDDFPPAGLAADFPGFFVARFVAIRGHPRLLSNARSV